MDAGTLTFACALIVGSSLYARFMLKSKYPPFLSIKMHAYAVCITVIIIAVCNQTTILTYETGLSLDNQAMLDFGLVVGSMLVIGFLRKGKYVKPYAMQGIHILKGQSPFEVAIPQWFDWGRDQSFCLEDLASYDIEYLQRLHLRF